MSAPRTVPDRPYHVDGEPMSSSELINLAIKLGYSDDGLYTTSGAAEFLRQRGAVVGVR
jgi:hypothetical protein